MASADFTDPYIDPETGILHNKVGARSQRDLDAAEADLAAYRALELFQRPIKATGDLGELRADNYLRGMDRRQFIQRLAHHYDQWNYGHPFREGNGRATRLFWTGRPTSNAPVSARRSPVAASLRSRA